LSTGVGSGTSVHTWEAEGGGGGGGGGPRADVAAEEKQTTEADPITLPLGLYCFTGITLSEPPPPGQPV
jgi:hypothetical protein